MSGIPARKAAFGWPGLEPRWTQGNKQGVGTAYSAGSRIWFTIFQGVITETYFPTVDRPQLRDLQYLVTDGETFFHDEKRHLETKVERGSDHALHFSVINSDPAGRYSIIKEVITHPHHACLLQKTQLTGSDDFLDTLRLYLLCAPHLEVGGWNNYGHVMEIGGGRFSLLKSKEPGLFWQQQFRSLECHAATSQRATAGPIWQTTFKWIGSLMKHRTAISP